MSTIRPFRNADLPHLVDVWSQHWSCIGVPPPVAMATIEQAILARTFFVPEDLLIAESDGKVRAWCHFAIEELGPTEINSAAATEELVSAVRAICFSPNGGLEVCEDLLREVEVRSRERGASRVNVGLVRDASAGYAGLPPIGHGIGIPSADSRASSLLSRSGYNPQRSVCRLVVSTSPYRPPVSREALQLRRTTRVEYTRRIPNAPRLASALAHFDIDRHQAVDHRSAEVLAAVELWSSDVEAQVMNCDNAILDLSLLKEPSRLTSAENFLIGCIIQTLADRRVYTVETAVDSNQAELIRQLEALQFRNLEQGCRWCKQFE